MESPVPNIPKSACRFPKADGELCKRTVAPPETRCWQHASSLKHKWKSLTRNQSLAFVLIVLGLILTVVLGGPSLYYSYRESHQSHNVNPGIAGESQPPPSKPEAKIASHPPEPSKPDKTIDLGVHSPNETVTLPPGSKATFAYGKMSPKDLETLNKMDKESIDARDHLEHDSNKLVLHDLFLTDFSSIENTATNRGGFNITNDNTGGVTHIEYMIVRQLETGTKLLKFYILYTNDTEGICKALSNLYQTAVNDFLEGTVDAEKIPGDSEQTTSQDLVLSNRIFIYHEAYLSPEQIIAVRDAFKMKGLTVILRSTDYLSNKQLEAKVKQLEGKQ
jgi:hypothetical protein